MTLSIGGARHFPGSITANVMQTVVSYSVSGPGVGLRHERDRHYHARRRAAGGFDYQRTGCELPLMVAAPGQYRADAGQHVGFDRQPAAIYDGGLFQSAPTALQAPPPAATATTLATVVLTMGGRPDIAIVQPGP